MLKYLFKTVCDNTFILCEGTIHVKKLDQLDQIVTDHNAYYLKC